MICGIVKKTTRGFRVPTSRDKTSAVGGEMSWLIATQPGLGFKLTGRHMFLSIKNGPIKGAEKIGKRWSTWRSSEEF